jgi:hypothetical protein
MGNDLKVTLSLVDDFTQKLTGVQTQMGAFGKQLDYINNVASKFGLGIGIGIGATAISGQIKDLIEAGKQWNQVENQLKESLGYTSIALNEQAATLSNKYKIDEKEILTVQQRLSLYTQDEDRIKKITSATIDYANATGKDLLTATKLVSIAIETTKGSVRGLAGHLDGAAESSERLDSITNILNKHFHGQAEAVEESKNWFDRLTFSIEKTKRAMGISLFGNKSVREMQEIEERKKFIEDYENGMYYSQREELKDNYELQLKIVGEYEKMIGEEKKRAAEQQKTDLEDSRYDASVDNMRKNKTFNIDPLKKEKQKEAERKAKEALQNQKEADKQFLKLIHDDAETQYKDLEAKEKKKEELDDMGYKTEADKWKAIYKGAEENDKRIEELHKKEQEEQKKHNEIMTGYAMELGEKFGSDIGAGLAKGKVDMKQAMKDVLVMTVDFLEKEEIAAIAANTLHNVVTEGYWGLVVGAAEAAGITALGEAAKGAINSFAVGTPYSSGGMAMVGERGPERVMLPRGSQVQTAGQTAATGGGSGGEVHIHIHDANGNVLEAATQQLRSRQTADRFVSMVFSHANKMGIN